MSEIGTNLENKQSSLSETVIAVAEKWGLGKIAREAQEMWGLTEVAGDTPLRRIAALPAASMVMLEDSIVKTPLGEEIRVEDVIKGAAEFLFPNPIGWKTVMGGAIGGLAGGFSLGFAIEKNGTAVAEGKIGPGGGIAGPLVGALIGASLANRFLEQSNGS